jgi:hypothetical protein
LRREAKMFIVSNFSATTLRWWFSQIDDIDFNPGFQRKGNVWSTYDEAFLIDSILNGFDMPKIYIADFRRGDNPLNSSEKAFAIIDGKQRMNAMYKFFKGELCLNNDFEYFKNPSLELAGMNYDELAYDYPEIVSLFDNYNLSIMMVETDDKLMISQLFRRLNKGRSLTGAEVRNAITSKTAEIIRKIARTSFFKKNINFSTTRGQDLNVAAKVLLIESNGQFVETKRGNLDRFAEEDKDYLSDLEISAEKTRQVLRHMHGVFQDKDILLRSPGPITIYYWFVRENYKVYKDYIRPFLMFFQDELKENKKRMKAGRSDLDPDLSSYEIMNRSTNDQISLVGRYNIISKWFEQYLQEHYRGHNDTRKKGKIVLVRNFPDTI